MRKSCFDKLIWMVFDLIFPIFKRKIHVLTQLTYHPIYGRIFTHQGHPLKTTKLKCFFKDMKIILNFFFLLFGVVSDHSLEDFFRGEIGNFIVDLLFHWLNLSLNISITLLHRNIKFLHRFFNFFFKIFKEPFHQINDSLFSLFHFLSNYSLVVRFQFPLLLNLLSIASQFR